MSTEFGKKAKRCCSIEHDRLVVELGNCDKMDNDPSKWHRCARVTSRKSAARARACMLRK
jgi:hypothetical protein